MFFILSPQKGHSGSILRCCDFKLWALGRWLYVNIHMNILSLGGTLVMWLKCFALIGDFRQGGSWENDALDDPQKCHPQKNYGNKPHVL